MSLSVRSLSKRFGSRTVLRSLSCEFPTGQVSTVLGISGSGKSTLLRIIAGLDRPDEGDIYLNGQSIGLWSPQERDLGFVFQGSSVYEHLSVRQNLELPLRARNLSASERLKRVRLMADRFGLGHAMDQAAGTLSGGEAQRLAIGRALIRQPKVMLLDEPFSHLDATMQREAHQIVFRELRNMHVTAVLVTHNHQDAQLAGGPVFFLDDGGIAQSGTWEQLYHSPATAQIARVVSFLEPLHLFGILRQTTGQSVLVVEDLGIEVPVREGLMHLDLRDGAQCALFIRTETLQSSLPSPDVRQGVVATVQHSFHHGPVRYCVLHHPAGLLFEARAPETPVSPGDQVVVALEEAEQVLLWPDGGPAAGSSEQLLKA